MRLCRILLLLLCSLSLTVASLPTSRVVPGWQDEDHQDEGDTESARDIAKLQLAYRRARLLLPGPTGRPHGPHLAIARSIRPPCVLPDPRPRCRLLI